MRIFRLYVPGFMMAAALAAAACGGSGAGSSPTSPSPSPSPAPAPAPATTTISYSGIFAHEAFTGTATMTADVPVSLTASSAGGFQPLASITATGTARFTGASTQAVNLTGTYDTTTKTFALKGGAFTVDATVTDNTVSGTVKTPDGKTAGLVALPPVNVTPATSYCGTFRGDSTGKLNIVVSGGTVRGVAAQDGEPEPIELRGTATTTTVTLTWGQGSFSGVATGTIDNGRITNGSWSNSDGERGTWSGSSTGC